VTNPGKISFQPTSPVHEFIMVDALRGFAALSVLVYHVIEHTKWSDYPTSGPLVWFRTGFMGVNLFFVISGFVVAWNAFNLYKRNWGKFVRAFAIRRLCRIAPLYYLTIAVFLFIVIPGFMVSPVFPFHLWTHILFVHNFTYDTSGSINGVNWTVATEMQFYVCIALLTPLLIRMKPLSIILVATLAAWTWRFTAFNLVHDSPLRSSHLFFLTSNVPGSLDEFGIGIALATFMRTPRYHQLTQKPWFTSMCTIAGILVMTLAIKVFWLDSEFWSNILMVVFFRTLLAGAFCLVILTACQIKNRAVHRGAAPLLYLGTVSYGIYLWHLTCIELLKLVPGITPFVSLIATVIGTLVLSALSWRFLEQPFIRLAHSRVRSPQQRTGRDYLAYPLGVEHATEAQLLPH
jgi:peptidoglycan/LPS O-acetylase OafA/YrhL